MVYDVNVNAGALAYGSVAASDNADTAVGIANPTQAAADTAALGIDADNSFMDDGTPF